MKKQLIFLLASAFFMLAASPAAAQPKNKTASPAAKKKAVQPAKKPALPPEVKETDYPCTIDNSKQKAMFFVAKGKQPRPLLVALHTWGGSYKQSCRYYAEYCVKNNWNFIFPHFRGPNWTPDACGSDKAVQDIADAVAYMKKIGKVDESRVYLMGGSGGGHATLLLAGRHPELWTAVSAWCPISDIAAWHDECLKDKRYKGYSMHIRKACGGIPGENAQAKASAVKRSPLTYLANASGLKVDINAGIHDGHNGSVPVSHSLNAFNVLADAKDRLSKEDIDFITREEKIPATLGKAEKDPAFGRNVVHFRRQSRQVRVTVFEGGHTILYVPALNWLSRQRREKPADWSVGGKAKSAKAAEIFK